MKVAFWCRKLGARPFVPPTHTTQARANPYTSQPEKKRTKTHPQFPGSLPHTPVIG